MTYALLLAAALASPPAVPAAAAHAAPSAPPTSSPAEQLDRTFALRARYDALYRNVGAAPSLHPAVKDQLVERTSVGAQTAKLLVTEPDADVLDDLERRAALDEVAVAALLGGPKPAVTAKPGAHVGVATAGDHAEPFAYWVPARYDAAKPGPIVVLFHSAIQPETDWVARVFFRELADATGTIILAPGGNDRDPAAMVRSVDAAEHALRPVVAWDPKRHYVGGFSDGTFGAFHAVALLNEPCAGFLGIEGFMMPADARAAGARLRGHGAYIVAGTADDFIPIEEMHKLVRTLRGEHVYARLYEPPNAPHALRPIYTTIARAWRDMLAGTLTIPNDGYGAVVK